MSNKINILFKKMNNLSKEKNRRPFAGRPSKKEILDFTIACNLAKYGHTMKEIADIVGVVESTIYLWLATDKKFSESIKKGKEVADKRVEDSLYHRAIGYTHEEEKIFQYEGEIIRTTTLKHYPPDPLSMIFWLKNRKPEEWRDKTEQNVNVNLNLAERIQDARLRAMDVQHSKN